MRAVLCLALCLSGCGGVVLERLQEDLEALRARVHAREEVRIHVAAAEHPVTKTSQRGDPSEPHVTVAVPPCPPPTEGLVQQVLSKKKASARKARRARLHK